MSYNTRAYKAHLTQVLNETSPQKNQMRENLISSLGQSSMYCHTGFKRPKSVIGGHIEYQDQYLGTVASNGNECVAAEVSLIGCRDQWLLATPGTTDNRDRWSYANYFSLNPLQGIPAGEIVDSAIKPKTDRMCLLKSTTFMDMMNTTNMGVYVTVFAFVSKGDTNSSLSAYVHDLYEEQDVYNTDSFIPGGGIPPGVTGNQYVDYSAFGTGQGQHERIKFPPYTYPFKVAGLKKNYKLIGLTNISLAPGDNHRLTINAVHNQYVIKQTINTEGNYTKGCLIYVVQVQGALAVDTTTRGEPPNETLEGTFGLAPTFVRMSITRKLHFATCKSPNQRIDSSYYGNTEISTGAGGPQYKTFLQGNMAAQNGAALGP